MAQKGNKESDDNELALIVSKIDEVEGGEKMTTKGDCEDKKEKQESLMSDPSVPGTKISWDHIDASPMMITYMAKPYPPPKGINLLNPPHDGLPLTLIQLNLSVSEFTL